MSRALVQRVLAQLRPAPPAAELCRSGVVDPARHISFQFQDGEFTHTVIIGSTRQGVRRHRIEPSVSAE